MNNNIQIFENQEFGKIRTIIKDGEIWFIGKDAADILGYANTRDALLKRVDEEDKLDGVAICDSIGREQTPILINESGLYSLILSSKLPTAKKFKRWITGEVLPSIRKHGGYIQGQESMTDEELMLKALQIAQKKIEEKNRLITKQTEKIEEDKPKVIFADSVAGSKTSILIGELAKLIKQNGYDIGQNRLYEWLRANGYLINRRGNSYNSPTQRSMDMKLFEVKERTIISPDNNVIIKRTVMVTGKGQIYFVNKFK